MNTAATGRDRPGPPPASFPADAARTNRSQTPQTEPPADARVSFLGVRFDQLTLKEAASLILSRPEGSPFAPVVTPNASHVVRIERSEELAFAYSRAWLCLNDSRAIELLARWKGLDLPAVPGADLVVELLADPQFARSAPVLLVGGDTELFKNFISTVGLLNAVHYDAPMGLLSNREAFEETVAFIEAHPAQFVFLAIGSPQQEMLAERLRRRRIATGVGLCIGASVEFLTGRRRRAPAWVSRWRIEWLFRLACEPRRLWRRYLVESPKILRLFLREKRR
ncbi:WecB/TagA/CpsF family glycosyltransferase [Hansschlegelia plantiphila]|uniref:Glycosyl transferase n=1 Tax=Hansschlegelia plantiphila TaxID=374655 RepID=A0A9W6J175_9HYPH|nr:WecB/TagA/CpsF family glycosyltransferase [Hansschlegelia plantiphila]GLK68837.1 glycosyl transferase [Hansschlegelia plantiphila]